MLLPVLLVVACNSLDLPPINIVQDKDVFASESGVSAFITRLYEELPIEDFRFSREGFQGFNYPALANFTGEMLLCETDMVRESVSGDWWGWWGYSSVRNVNYFLSAYPNYQSSFTTDQTNRWMGEAHFVRAFYYFAMAKRYGAVPIVKEVQNFPEQSLEELKVSRDSEKAVYDFIADELDKAIALLPEKSSQTGRVNKYVAYALKSRAMLYAGSIAQYGKIQLDGLLGIPAADASKYYQASYDASVALEGHYSLYTKYADKFENYWRLFLDNESSENIFCKYYKYPERTHLFDLLHVPYQMRGSHGYSSRLNPTLELVELFDSADGTSGILQLENTDGTPRRFDKTMDLFQHVEPRLRASVILPGDVFKGESIEIQKGLYESYPSDKLYTSTTSNDLYQGKRIIGKSGMGHQEMTSTGFLMRKYQNADMPLVLIQEYSEQPWIAFRYAEILLNRAEAGFQLGKTADALTCINNIRDRAGAKAYAPAQLTAKSIQKERRMELAFENHTYWDLRRWRIADSEISNTQYHSLCPYYIFAEDKFIFRKEPVSIKYTFDVKCNYVKVPTSEIAKNDKLLPNNPGY